MSSAILYNHESPRRHERFVTRKITSTVAAIARGDADELVLGNLDARRDWGWAPDYVDAMVRAARADEPGDYVVATGRAHSVREFVAAAFAAAGVDDWEHLVRQDERFFRPADPTELVGDASRARDVLGWAPTVAFEEIVARMVAADLLTAVLQQPEQVLAVAALAERLGALDELVVGEPAHPPGDLLGRADLEALPALDGAHEVGGVVERVEGAGVEPGGAARQHLDVEAPLLEVAAVEVGDLQLAARRRRQLGGVLHHVVVVEVEPRDREVALGVLGLLLQRERRPWSSNSTTPYARGSATW